MWFAAKALSVLCLFLCDPVHAATSSSPITSITPSTSPFRTVNYITHSLPQQCLASSRKANITSTASESSGSSNPDLTSSIFSVLESPSNVSSFAVSSADPSSSTSDRAVSPLPTAEEDSTRSLSQTEAPDASSSIIVDKSEDDSPLDDGKFMSFEDWKRENLKKSGQSEHIGMGLGVENREPRKRPAALRDSLDSLGDDAEIDLDFSGFVSDGLDPPNQGQPRAGQGIRDNSGIEPGRAPKAGVSKDAGTTCKERFNYASFDCAANVLKNNPEARSASAVLGNNKDSYMLNECSAQNKFLILELCDDISIDTVVLANFEFFSSTFRIFRVSVSDKYPVKVDKWKTLGTFEARNTREVQAFLVENPVIWTRYLRIEFLTHYGNEFYCPVSLVRVHGTTMLEEYKHDLESLQTEDEDKATEESEDPSAEDRLVPEAVAEQLLTRTNSDETAAQTFEVDSHTAFDASQVQAAVANATQIPSVEDLEVAMLTSPVQFTQIVDDSRIESNTIDMCETVEHSASTSDVSEAQPVTQASGEEVTKRITGVSGTGAAGSGVAIVSVSSTSNTTATTSNTLVAASSNFVADPKALNASSSPDSTNSTKTSVSSTQSPHPAPTMQESFFKSVQKRLQMLEANSSLSLQYIEDQSRALRDAFQKVEQRQLAKTTSFLEYLNSTVLNELREFRQQYDQLWQSTVIELEMQRERYQQENAAINARLGVLADEIIFQKRVSFLQLILIVICLGLVLFSKGSLNSYLELPLVQSVLSRSPSTRFLNLTSPDSPSQNSPISRPNSTGGVRKRSGILKGHRRFPSEDSTENATSPTDMYTPPSPVSFDNPSSEGEDEEDNDMLGDPEFDPRMIERPSTSPPVLSATESPITSELDGDIGDDSIDSVLNSTPTNVFERRAPILIVEDATPPPKHLKWQLPEG